MHTHKSVYYSYGGHLVLLVYYSCWVLLFLSIFANAQVTSLGAYLNKYKTQQYKNFKINLGVIPKQNLKKTDPNNRVDSKDFLKIKTKMSNTTPYLSYAICASSNIFYKPFSSMEIRKDSLFVDCSSRNISLINQADQNFLNNAAAMTFSNNKIEIINYHFQNENLIELDLSKNKIESISKSAFYGLTNLQFLNLAENQLTTLNTEIFYDLHSLRNKLFLVLRKNPWNCNCTLQAVTNNFEIYDKDHSVCLTPEYLKTEPLARLISPYHKNIMTYNTCLKSVENYKIDWPMIVLMVLWLVFMLIIGWKYIEANRAVNYSMPNLSDCNSCFSGGKVLTEESDDDNESENVEKTDTFEKQQCSEDLENIQFPENHNER